MHVTLRFFGPTNEAQLESLRALVPRLAAAPLESLRAKALDAFPSPKRARVVVIALLGPLSRMAAEAERAARALGFEKEARAYHPHLTLARLKAPADLRALCSDPLALPEARAVAVTLYESKTLPSGPVYTPLVRASRRAALPARSPP